MSAAPDLKERQRALDPARSFIVEAPAGSGKTTLLVQRFLSLLAHVDRPEAVVAMTFTRKAAAEMRRRVTTALTGADGEASNSFELEMQQLAHAVLRRDEEKGWRLVNDLSRLQIQTIDSFCSLLTRQMPIVSNLGGSPKVVEHAEELYLQAARRTLQALAEGDEEQQSLFRKVSLHVENNLSSLERQVAVMLAKREQWRAFQRDNASSDVLSFLDLLFAAERELQTLFREAGEVDFTAITRAAIEALGTPEAPSDLLFWLDYRIEHILVDEFQDTSRAQYRLLKALTEQWSAGDNRTLFLVGDPMQSIYRFREAEIALFLRCWHSESLADVPLTPIRLTANFRSSPEIVSWVQKTFHPLVEKDNEKDGAVRIRPAVATRGKTGVAPKVLPFIADDGIKEADKIVQILASMPTRGDVAILVRSRPQLFAILPALRSAGIAYEASEIDALTDEQHILDLLSITRALVHPADRIAWLSCLRAPWCGLDMTDLATLTERDGRTVPEILQDTERVWALSSEGRLRVGRVGAVLLESAGLVGRMALRDLVERTWMTLGGPAVLKYAAQAEDVATFLELIEEMEVGGTILDFSLLDQRLKVLFARPVSTPNSVKVMTVHAAKGLEFDAVILPQLHKRAGQSDSNLLVWNDDQLAVKPKDGQKDPLYDSLCESDKERERNERKRLLYVAVTRAKSRLYLLGSADRAQGGKLKKPGDNTPLGLIWPQVEEEFQAAIRREMQPAQRVFAFPSKAPAGLRQMPVAWQPPKMNSSFLWKPGLRSAVASTRKITYEWVTDTSRHAGTIVHEVLKRVAREGVVHWDAGRVSGLTPLLHSELQRLGVDEVEIEGAAAKIEEAVGNTLASLRGRWILSEHVLARSEWAIQGQVGNKLVTGSIDRAFRDEEGRFWIVDFKTSRHEGSNLMRFLDEEQRRYREQLETYAHLVAQLEPGPIFVGLYFPLHDAWREWQYSEQTATAS